MLLVERFKDSTVQTSALLQRTKGPRQSDSKSKLTQATAEPQGQKDKECLQKCKKRLSCWQPLPKLSTAHSSRHNCYTQKKNSNGTASALHNNVTPAVYYAKLQKRELESRSC